MWAGEATAAAAWRTIAYDKILIAELSARRFSGFSWPCHNRVVGQYINNLANDERRRDLLPGV